MRAWKCEAVFCIILTSLFLLNGCGALRVRQRVDLQGKTEQKHGDDVEVFVSGDESYHQELMLADVPIPLYDSHLFAPYFDQSSEDVLLGYQTSLAVDQLVHFYDQEMERLGWKLIKLFQTHETVMCYETPYRICIVSLRPHEQLLQTDLFIFTGYKRVIDCDE